jgi:hypothetical protein
MKLDLLTNATVVNGVITSVLHLYLRNPERINTPSSGGDENESNETDYNEDEDQLEEEQE